MIVNVLRNRGSRSARRLAEALGVSLITSGSTRRTRGDRFVINWGVGQPQNQLVQRNLTYSNTAQSVIFCSNKINTFNRLIIHDVPCVGASWPGALPMLDAWNPAMWLEEDGKIVVRHTITGHSGAGLEIIRRGQPIPVAPLYTRYFRKHAEYRVHVCYGNVILIQQKRKENGADVDTLVRTRANGWVFTVQDLSCDARNYRAELGVLALDAARAVGANHCAVDILVNHDSMNKVVVEINSAPALEAESSLNAYVDAFRNHINSL